MNNYAVLETGTNGNLVATADGTNLTYLQVRLALITTTKLMALERSTQVELPSVQHQVQPTTSVNNRLLMVDHKAIN